MADAAEALHIVPARRGRLESEFDVFWDYDKRIHPQIWEVIRSSLPVVRAATVRQRTDQLDDVWTTISKKEVRNVFPRSHG